MIDRSDKPDPKKTLSERDTGEHGRGNVGMPSREQDISRKNNYNDMPDILGTGLAEDTDELDEHDFGGHRA